MAAASLPGLEAIRKIAAGELPPPPIAQLLDFEITLVEPGRVIFAFTPAEWMYNPIGSVHGGVAATLLDSSLGCAIHTTLAAGQRYTTSDLQVRYVRAMSARHGAGAGRQPRRARGRKLATAEGRLYAEDERQAVRPRDHGCLTSSSVNRSGAATAPRAAQVAPAAAGGGRGRAARPREPA